MLKKSLKELFRIIFRIRKFNFYYNRDSRFEKIHSLPVLTKEEINEIKKTWPNFIFSNKNHIWSKIYKKNKEFSPYFLNDYQYEQLLECTNKSTHVIALQNKAMLDIWFPMLPWPEVYFRGINKMIFDRDMNVIDISKCVNNLIGKDFFIKPALETGCGRGVRKIKLTAANELKEILSSYLLNGDFIVQSVLQQHELLEKLNPTSFNTLRITTILINGKFGYSAAIKIGKENSFVDNWNSSILIGIDNDGKLLSRGYDNNLNIVDKVTGGQFAGISIPSFTEIISLVEKYHKYYFPVAGIIGWDIGIDTLGNPILVEINLDYPGILGEQLVSGDFFKSFVGEINNYMKINKK